MKAFRMAAIVAAASALSGCNLIEFYRVEPLVVRKADLPDDRAGKGIAEAPDGVLRSVNLDVYRLPVSGAPAGNSNAAQAAKSGNSDTAPAANSASTQTGTRIDEVTTKEQRNAWIGFLLDRSAKQCDYHQAAIITTQSAVNGIAGATAGLLGGAGALVTGATAARIFSGSAGAVTGLRAQYNEVVYQNLISTAVNRKIDELRAPKRAAIKSRMADSEKQYSMDEALLDIGEYHDLCSFHVGLVALTDDKQSLKPLTGNLEAQINSAKAAIDDYEKKIDAELPKLANASSDQKAISTARIQEWRQSVRDLEMIRRSAQNQLSLAASLSGKPLQEKPNGGNGANGSGNASGQTPTPPTVTSQ